MVMGSYRLEEYTKIYIIVKNKKRRLIIMGFRAYKWCGEIVYVEKRSIFQRIKRFFENRKTIKQKYGFMMEESGI